MGEVQGKPVCTGGQWADQERPTMCAHAGVCAENWWRVVLGRGSKMQQNGREGEERELTSSQILGTPEGKSVQHVFRAKAESTLEVLAVSQRGRFWKAAGQSGVLGRGRQGG